MTTSDAGPNRANRLIYGLTSLMSAPLVPEIQLYLANDSHAIWKAMSEGVEDEAAKRPYWAFAWPGGQATARYILDNPDCVAGKRVLDLGCGSAMGGIAAMRSGALSVLANDIDPLACAAAGFNATANDVVVTVSGDDCLAATLEDVDVVLLADVVYEPELQTRVTRFIETAARQGVPVYFADRGKTRLPLRPKAKLAEYDADVFPHMTDLRFERGIVWQLA